MNTRLVKLKYLADFNPPVPANVKSSNDKFPIYPMDKIESFGKLSSNVESRPISELLNGYSYLEPTDVAYAKVTPCFENGKGILGRDLAGPSFATTELTVLRPKPGVDQRYLAYLLQTPDFMNPAISSMTGAGGLKRVSEEYVKNIKFPLPSLEEQKRIADKLDCELAEIDELVADQQRLQDLSVEQYFSQLHHLVTKGVNKSPNLTDTNIDWIGSIPSHWSLQKIGWLFKDIGSGTTPSTSDESAFEAGTINWVTTGELRETGISTTKHQINQETLSRYSALKIHPANSLLIAMYGATIGRLGWLEEPATTNQAVCALSNPTNVLPKYSFYVLLTARQHLLTLATGGGQPNINQEIIRNLHIPVPPIEEQNKIVKKAEEMHKNIDSLMKELQFLNFLLNQKKRYLIDNLIRFKDRAEEHHSSTFI